MKRPTPMTGTREDARKSAGTRTAARKSKTPNVRVGPPGHTPAARPLSRARSASASAQTKRGTGKSTGARASGPKPASASKGVRGTKSATPARKSPGSAATGSRKAPTKSARGVGAPSRKRTSVSAARGTAPKITSIPVAVPGNMMPAPPAAGPTAMPSPGPETRPLAEPAFTMILRGHQTVDAIPAVEAEGLRAGSVLMLKNARGLMSRNGPPATRTMEAKLAKDPEVFPTIEALLAKHPFREVLPVATSAASAATHYRSVFTRNADAPVALLQFKKDPDLVDAP